MPISLPLIIQRYVDASNAHDVKSILACFADETVVRDEKKNCEADNRVENWVKSQLGKL
jgi:hypothetical protein